MSCDALKDYMCHPAVENLEPAKSQRPKDGLKSEAFPLVFKPRNIAYLQLEKVCQEAGPGPTNAACSRLKTYLLPCLCVTLRVCMCVCACVGDSAPALWVLCTTSRLQWFALSTSARCCHGSTFSTNIAFFQIPLFHCGPNVADAEFSRVPRPKTNCRRSRY